MNERAAAKWSRTRQMGKAKYVMLRGVLLWGVSLTVLFTAIEWMTQQTMLSSWLTVRLLVFGIIGFFVANFQWDGRERKYAELAVSAGMQSNPGGSGSKHRQGGQMKPNKPKTRPAKPKRK